MAIVSIDFHLRFDGGVHALISTRANELERKSCTKIMPFQFVQQVQVRGECDSQIWHLTMKPLDERTKWILLIARGIHRWNKWGNFPGNFHRANLSLKRKNVETRVCIHVYSIRPYYVMVHEWKRHTCIRERRHPDICHYFIAIFVCVCRWQYGIRAIVNERNVRVHKTTEDSLSHNRIWQCMRLLLLLQVFRCFCIFVIGKVRTSKFSV